MEIENNYTHTHTYFISIRLLYIIIINQLYIFVKRYVLIDLSNCINN